MTIYTGDIIEQEIEEIRQNLSLDNLFYNFDSEDGAIDSKFMGNKSRFINHQDEGKENLEAKETSSNGKNVIAFYAIRDIKQHEELYFDYDGNG